jgi:hypothetical protein
MTHVWQNQNVGPIYLAHAAFSQITMGDAAYNYGYTPAASDVNITIPDAKYGGASVTAARGELTGEGAIAVLNAKTGSQFMDFPPEQQGQIMMHYFVRKELLGKPQSDYAPWRSSRTGYGHTPAGRVMPPSSAVWLCVTPPGA